MLVLELTELKGSFRPDLVVQTGLKVALLEICIFSSNSLIFRGNVKEKVDIFMKPRKL